MTDSTRPEGAAHGSRLSRGFSLIGALAALLAFDLVLRRLLWPLLRVDLLLPQGRMREAADFLALLSLNASSVLAILLALVGLTRLLVFPSVIPRGAKAAVGALAVAWLPLLIGSMARPLPRALSMYLHASSACLLVLLTLAGLLAGRITARARIGLLVSAAPALLLLPWSLATAGGASAAGESALPALSLSAAETAVLVSACAALPCFLPRRPRFLLPTAATVALVGGAAILAVLDFDLARRFAVHGVGIELPMAPLPRAACLAALGAWSFTTVALLVEGGPARLRGYGLLLLGLAGFPLELPHQLASALLGILCIVESYAREGDATLIPLGAFRSLAQRVAGLVGASEVELSGAPGRETARVRSVRDDQALDLRLGRDSGALRLELVVGTAPPDSAPPISLTSHRSSRLGPTAGPLVMTGDAAFDGAFQLRDARRLDGPDPILDDRLRARLLERVAPLGGWLAVWPGEGVRYRLRPGQASLSGARDEDLLALVDLLVEMKSR